jgi:hypothetical protein
MKLRISAAAIIMGPPSLDPAQAVLQWEEFWQSCLLDVHLDVEAGYLFRLDAFQFLYRLLDALYRLRYGEAWSFGEEGLLFELDPIQDRYQLTLGFDNDTVFEPEITMLDHAATMVFLAELISDTVTAMRQAGIDVDAYMDKYRPFLA